MIKVSVLYPNISGESFDIDYYCSTHVPMVGKLLGGAEGEAAPFVAMGHLLFDSVEEFQSSFGPNAEQIMADLPNFTTIQPQIQISDVKL